ncbi:MAG: phage major tail tube protein [Sedimentibacter sp.]
MAKIDESVINFAVYEDSVEYAGMAQATLPDLTALTQSISGSGIAGNVEAVILGHFEAMTLGLNFRTTTEQAIKLSEPRRHTIDLRVAQQVEDTVAGAVVVQAVKHLFVVVPKKDTGGSIAPAAPTDASGEYAVRYWATYINGVKKREIDPLNFIYFVNGVDYLSDVKRVLGK